MIVRPTSRLLAFDPVDRLLLFECDEDDGTFWLPPGGGVEPGGTHEAAALRELREETSIETTTRPARASWCAGMSVAIPTSGMTTSCTKVDTSSSV